MLTVLTVCRRSNSWRLTDTEGLFSTNLRIGCHGTPGGVGI